MFAIGVKPKIAYERLYSFSARNWFATGNGPPNQRIWTIRFLLRHTTERKQLPASRHSFALCRTNYFGESGMTKETIKRWQPVIINKRRSEDENNDPTATTRHSIWTHDIAHVCEYVSIPSDKIKTEIHWLHTHSNDENRQHVSNSNSFFFHSYLDDFFSLLLLLLLLFSSSPFASLPFVRLSCRFHVYFDYYTFQWRQQQSTDRTEIICDDDTAIGERITSEQWTRVGQPSMHSCLFSYIFWTFFAHSIHVIRRSIRCHFSSEFFCVFSFIFTLSMGCLSWAYSIVICTRTNSKFTSNRRGLKFGSCVRNHFFVLRVLESSK